MSNVTFPSLAAGDESIHFSVLSNETSALNKLLIEGSKCKVRVVYGNRSNNHLSRERSSIMAEEKLDIKRKYWDVVV